MSGLEFVQGLVDGSLPLNTMARTLGYDITEVEVAGSSSLPCQMTRTSIRGRRAWRSLGNLARQLYGPRRSVKA